MTAASRPASASLTRSAASRRENSPSEKLGYTCSSTGLADVCRLQLVRQQRRVDLAGVTPADDVERLDKTAPFDHREEGAKLNDLVVREVAPQVREHLIGPDCVAAPKVAEAERGPLAFVEQRRRLIRGEFAERLHRHSFLHRAWRLHARAIA